MRVGCTGTSRSSRLQIEDVKWKVQMATMKFMQGHHSEVFPAAGESRKFEKIYIVVLHN